MTMQPDEDSGESYIAFPRGGDPGPDAPLVAWAAVAILDDDTVACGRIDAATAVAAAERAETTAGVKRLVALSVGDVGLSVLPDVEEHRALMAAVNARSERQGGEG